MIGPDLHAGPRCPANRQRRETDVTKAAHAHRRHLQAGTESARSVDPGVDDAGTIRQRVYRDLQFLRVRHTPVGHRAGTIIQPHSTLRHRPVVNEITGRDYAGVQRRDALDI